MIKDTQVHVGTYIGRLGQRGIDKDKQGQTWTDRDRQGQVGTDRDRQGQTGTDRDRKGQKGTDRDRKGLSLLVYEKSRDNARKDRTGTKHGQ